MVFTGKGITIDDILSKVRFPDVMNEQNIQPLIDFINNISDSGKDHVTLLFCTKQFAFYV
ncbi:hypothetical protein VK87_0201640 [Escherichia fergusonii]|nr:hypothetical protein VK87_0201640 [Escherichia fergusonii]